MKTSMMVSAALCACLAEGALAACAAPATPVADAAALLGGNTVCAVRGGDRWQEEHHVGGALWDFKRGDGDAVDPRMQVGTWDASGSVVNYSYTDGASYSYEVWDDGGSYSFCQAGTVNVDNVTVRPGVNVGCP